MASFVTHRLKSKGTLTLLSFDWDIENFFDLPKGEIYFQSPEFTFAESTWCLRLHPNGAYTDDDVQLYLEKLKSFIKCHDVSFTMGIKNGDGTIYNSHYIKYCFEGYTDMFGAEIAKKSELLHNRWNLAPMKKLTVFMKDLFIHNSNEDSERRASNSAGERAEKEDSVSSDEEGVDILARDLKDLFLNEDECDITFKVENREFRAHHAVLVARSPVFASMFRHDMSEKNTGVVDVPDCGADAFKELLLYLYSGKVTHSSSDITFDLYEASVKYDLEHLKKKCVLFMKDDMSVDTFCDILAISLKHNEIEIINIATDFFTQHIKDILPTVKWLTFLKENPIATNELLIKAMEKNK